MAPPQTLELVLTTEASVERAERLARELLDRRLVVCASWTRVVSLYRWQGEVVRSGEVQLLLKTGPGRLAALRRALEELHSYDTPEWIHWPAASDGAYGQWLSEGLRDPDGPPPDPSGTAGSGAPSG
jgi:periplasmic divalent cation tolerance protein